MRGVNEVGEELVLIRYSSCQDGNPQLYEGDLRLYGEQFIYRGFKFKISNFDTDPRRKRCR